MSLRSNEPGMTFTIKVPEAWKHGIPADDNKAFCATTNLGEYAVTRGSNGLFAVLLDGVALTGFVLCDAVKAMDRAKQLQQELSAHM